MKRNNPAPNPTRQSPLAILLFVFSFAKNMIRQFWWIILIVFLNPARRSEIQFLLGFVVLSLFSTLASIIAYFRFYYHLTDTDFKLESGVLRKKSIQIPFERIQSIRIEQSLLHQIFNIVKLEIDTAGSKNNELSITAISMDHAQELRAFILEKKKGLSKDQKNEWSEETTTNQAEDKGALLFQLSFGDLIKIGISQNHLRTLGIILAFFLSIANRIIEMFAPNVEDWGVEEVALDSFWSTIAASVFVIPLILLISVGISVFQISMRYADFSTYKTKEGLRMVFGLFTRIEQIAISRKMQIISLETNPIRRLLGLVKVRIFQAASNELQLNESIMVPGCSKAQASSVVASYMDPSIIEKAVFNGVDPKYRLRLFLLTGTLPLTALTVVAYINFGWDALYLFALIPAIAIIAHWYYKRLLYAVSPDWVIKKEGVFGQKTTLLKMHKIQSVEIYRGFYQLRHGLATVIIHTAARPVSIPFVTLEQANLLVDYLSFRVESSRKHWM